ncbi:uncharacterized protein LOC111026944 [Myzus persicae]|uniref:uncharacterized protein LOC111026944 n=1 Tax=Myzus persicae TaxID=13164 RepID=UPI000B934AAD|nr:uncharacterized protein LOC111026944 [Myzus persicae]
MDKEPQSDHNYASSDGKTQQLDDVAELAGKDFGGYVAQGDQVRSSQPVLPGSSNDFVQKSTVPSGADSNLISINKAQEQSIDTNSLLAVLLEQNRLLMNQMNEIMQQRSAPSPVSVHSVGSNGPNGYYVMPDFHQSLPDFIGTESHAEASNWIKGINSTADLHSWPDTFKLEIVRTKLKGAARNWYLGRNFSSWEHFEQQFKDAFIGTLASIVDLTKLLIARQQRKGETVNEYFHDKARMCRELKLDFDESKRQIVEGIFSRELCVYLLSRSHRNENELLIDIVTFNKINDSRAARFKTVPRPAQEEVLTKTDSLKPVVVNKLSSSVVNPKQSSHKGKARCYNCGSFEHISPACTKPKRPKGSCFKCGSADHQISQCPSDQGPANIQHQQAPNDSAMVLQQSDVVTPAYIINIDVKFNNSLLSNILAVVDTGSPISLIREQVLPELTEIVTSPTNSGIVGINGSELIILGQMYVDVFQPNIGDPLNIKLKVVPNDTIKCDCLLGRDFLSHPRVIFGVNNGSFEIEIKRSDIISFNEILNLEILNIKNDSIDLRLDHTLPEHIRVNMNNIYRQFYLDNTNEQDNEPLVSEPLQIVLKSQDVFSFQPRRLSYYEKNKLQEIINSLLENGVIRESNSEYSSPIVLVKKKSGELRLCVDYRELNKRCCRDRYPIPLIDDHLDLLRGKKYFSSLDLKDGFHHIEVAESSRKYTSFISPLGQYEFCKMPFGLCNGPKTLEDQLNILSRVFDLMRKHKLQLRLDKCQFLKREIIYLGYQVDASGIRPNPKNVSVIKDYPVPNQINAFELIKLKLCENPLLCLFNPGAETELHCDASSQGFGSILLQKQSDGKFHPIFFYSHRTSDAESRYHSFELEMLAIVNSIKRFRIYLQGIRFKIVTDCNSITMTLAKKDINPRIARWALFLQDFDYQIEHRPGTRMQHVDALSRNHILVIEGCTFNQALSIKQSCDPEIKKLVKMLESSEHKLYEFEMVWFIGRVMGVFCFMSQLICVVM